MNLLICVLLCSFVSVWCRLGYKCFPNATMEVTNPDTSFIFAKVWDDFNECQHSFSDDFSLITLDNCRMNTHVHLLLYKKDANLRMLSSYAGPFDLLCKQIPLEGVIVPITVHIHVPIIVDAAVKVTYIKSAIQSGTSGKSRILTQEVGLNENLDWTFDVPAHLTAMPEECIAYPGTTPTGSVSKTLIQNGCSTSLKFVSDFARVDSPTAGVNKLLSATFESFLYKKIDYVTIVCSLRICEDDNASNCKMDCGNPLIRSRRHVRNEPQDAFEDVVLTINVLQDHKSAAPSSIAGKVGIIGSLLLCSIASISMMC